MTTIDSIISNPLKQDKTWKKYIVIENNKSLYSYKL